MRTYYIIEHSSKGVFFEWHDWELKQSASSSR